MSNWPTNGNLTGTLSIGQGEPGKSLEYEWRGTELGIRVEGEEEYQFVNLGAVAGREIELQVGSGYLQWRYKDEEEWNDLISIDSLKGEPGEQGLPGETGPQGIPGKDGKQGPQGLPGRDGVDGKDGKNGIDGTNGQDGVTPNITIGTVTTLEPGEKATVTKRGTKEEPIFDFGIPRGNDGVGGTSGNITLVTTEIIDGKLNLTTDRYQTTTMEDNTTIVLPEVEELTEICLVFNTTSELTITFPKIRWYKQPNIRKDKINKFTFSYINGEWLGEHFSYYNSTMMPIMDGLICWLDGFDLPVTVNNKLTNDTVWENKVEGGEDAIIRTIVGNEVEGVENGYFRTNGNGYVILPSFMANDDDGISAFVDGKINKRPSIKGTEKFLTLGFSPSWQNWFSIFYGESVFGQVRTFESKTIGGLLGDINTATFPMLIKIGANTSKAKNYSNNSVLKYTSNTKYNQIFNNNFLNADNPTSLHTGDISYGLVLIYNRELTEEEMLHNHMYSLSIERGE